MKVTRSSVLVVAALALAAVTSCKEEPPAAVPVPPPPPTPTQTMPPPTPVPTTPETSMATPVPATGAQMLEPAFREVVKKEIGPGMTPDGSAFAGNFQEGQTLEQPFQVQPGKCYTIVASSLGITELDAQVVFQLPPMPPYVAAQDQQSGPIATIGTKGNCIKNPFPVGAPAKVVLKATSGAGLAMAQIYLK